MQKNKIENNPKNKHLTTFEPKRIKTKMNTKLQLVKNLCEKISQLKLEMAREKLLWEQELPMENSLAPVLKPVTATIIQEYETKLSRYESALAEARSENRENRRRLNDIVGHRIKCDSSRDEEYYDAVENLN